ncbi:hypothetical protein CL633_00145 [bacterium]|nr:hypothetical protein [bacterium]|tara:strand:+ start:2511 stop:2972 length:462 start_codon:yes stop_codon:yes gene_type:complete
MFLTTHALIGALIGLHLENHIWLAFFLGIGSHFLLDIIPHGDRMLFVLNEGGDKDQKKLFSVVAIDCFLVLLFLIFITQYKHPEAPMSIMMGIMGSIIPDYLWGMHEHWHFKFLRKYHDFHLFFHQIIKQDVSFKKGLTIQILILLIFLKWLL